MKTVAVEGVRVAYAEAGEGEPLLLLHGYPQDHRTWRKQMGALARRRRVIAPDWFGWGASERSLALDYRYGEEVRRVGTLADALGLGAFDLFAHDYGGFLALGFLTRSPERVRRFAILNCRAHRTFPQPHYAVFASIEAAARVGPLRPLLTRLPWAAIHRRRMRRYVRAGCFDAALLGEYVDWMGTAEGARWFLRFFEGYETAVRPELAPSLSAVGCPTAVVWGDRDPYNPWSIAVELARAIPGAALTRVAGAGHYVMEERPAEVLAALEALLDRPAA